MNAPASPDRPPRIAYVVSLFPCYDETFILREIEALAARGVDLAIFSLRRFRQAVTQDGARAFLDATRYGDHLLSGSVLRALFRCALRRPLPVARLVGELFSELWRHPARLAKSLAFLPKSIYFAELAEREGIEHVHAHWATYPATTAFLISRLTGISWSFTCHAHDIFRDPILLEEKLRRARFVLTCTDHNRRYLEGLVPLPEGKVRVSYHGLDLQLFHPLAERPPAPGVRILAVGSLLPCKGFHRLIEAARLLTERGLEFQLTIAGGGPEDERLRRLARLAAIEERIRFTGFVTQAELVPLYQQADIFVLPAVSEIHWGIPNVLVEALACGVPVVTTALASVSELIDNASEGLLLEDPNPGALASAIESLARDPERRRAIGERGRDRVEKLFDIDRTIDSVLEPLLSLRAT